MIDTKSITSSQLALVRGIIKLYKGRTVVSRKELREAHGILRGRAASPYFIAKNKAAKVHGANGRGSYNLEVFLKWAVKHEPKAERVTAINKREAAPKREARTSKKEVARQKKAPATAKKATTGKALKTMTAGKVA